MRRPVVRCRINDVADEPANAAPVFETAWQIVTHIPRAITKHRARPHHRPAPRRGSPRPGSVGATAGNIAREDACRGASALRPTISR